jgi:hypothetical protein
MRSGRKCSSNASVGIPHRPFEIDQKTGRIPRAQKPPYRQTSVSAGQFHFRIGRFSQNRLNSQAHLLIKLGKYTGFRLDRSLTVDAKAYVELETVAWHKGRGRKRFASPAFAAQASRMGKSYGEVVWGRREGYFGAHRKNRRSAANVECF